MLMNLEGKLTLKLAKQLPRSISNHIANIIMNFSGNYYSRKEVKMKTIPDNIKQNGYIAVRNGDHYEMEYLSGGHFPKEDYVELTIEEMKRLFEDHSLWDELLLVAKKRMGTACS